MRNFLIVLVLLSLLLNPGCVSLTTTFADGHHSYLGTQLDCKFILSASKDFHPRWIPAYFLASLDFGFTLIFDTILFPWTYFNDPQKDYQYPNLDRCRS